MHQERWTQLLAEGEPFALQMGQRLQQVREEAEQTREDVARKAKALGLSWHRPTVGQIEQGKRGLTAVELLLLPLIYRVPLRDLLPGPDTVVRLTEATAVYGAELLRVLDVGHVSGHVGPGGWEFQHVTDALRDMAQKTSRILEDFPWRAMSEYVAVPDEAETKAAKRLNTTPNYVAYTSRELWGRGLAEERDERLSDRGDVPESPRAVQAARGHVTRALISELEPAIRRYEELRGQPDGITVEKTERGIRINLDGEGDTHG
ncbi:helix-turn-helix domain-containing protein [Streptomyces sp. NBC_00012]|uniref:helix-turn-helix transcriptional regulator n=1 Tax=Streptomyces sp. NBC_00012 TaxID=2975621 RepID=UPI00324933D8